MSWKLVMHDQLPWKLEAGICPRKCSPDPKLPNSGIIDNNIVPVVKSIDEFNDTWCPKLPRPNRIPNWVQTLMNDLIAAEQL